jgi:thioredoxin-related protein
MKISRVFSLLLALFFAVAAHAAHEGWMSDLEAAKAKAAKEGKGLLIEFTGSTWCGPCHTLERDVLKSPEFADFSKDLVLVALDYPPMSGRTPEKIQANPALAKLMAVKKEYDAPGFPTMLWYDAKGKQLGKVVGYDGKGAKAYLAKLGK